jgi:hypothetical protein
MPSKNPSAQPSRQGRTAIEEAAQLLRQIQFSHLRGAYAEGQHVAVSVDPRWNADEMTFRAVISCMAFGHRQVDWAQLPVFIMPESGGTPALARLTARGQTFLPSLVPGEYRLSLRSTPMRLVPVLSQIEERLAAQAENDIEAERRSWQGESEDGALLWTLEVTEDEEIQIAFETLDERLADATVIVNLLDPTSHQTRYSQQLRLAPTRTPGKWEVWRSLGPRQEFQGPYDLDFAIAFPDKP